MPTGPAARLGDPVAHPLPGVLTGSPGSVNVLIGGKPAWRGLPGPAALPLQGPKAAFDAAVQTAEAAAAASAGTPAFPAAKAALDTAKATALATMTSMIQSAAAAAAAAALGGTPDIHICTTPPIPPPPHGPGIVIDGSATVLINGLPAVRMGDTLLEALGPPDKIVMGAPNVIIGG